MGILNNLWTVARTRKRRFYKWYIIPRQTWIERQYIRKFSRRNNFCSAIVDNLVLVFESGSHTSSNTLVLFDNENHIMWDVILSWIDWSAAHSTKLVFWSDNLYILYIYYINLYKATTLYWPLYFWEIIHALDYFTYLFIYIYIYIYI